jgi:hypothetical protein
MQSTQNIKKVLLAAGFKEEEAEKSAIEVQNNIFARAIIKSLDLSPDEVDSIAKRIDASHDKEKEFAELFKRVSASVTRKKQFENSVKESFDIYFTKIMQACDDQQFLCVQNVIKGLKTQKQPGLN